MKLNPVFEGKAKVRPERDTLLLPYQSAWVLDESQMKLMEKSRQIGISWSTAYSIARKAPRKGYRFDTWCSSRDDIQARLLLDDVKSFSNILSKGFEDLGEKIYYDDNGKPYTSYEITYANTRKVYSMSSNPDAQAGKRGPRVLDEFALNPDPRKLFGIAQPGITWGGQLEIISTHRGSNNFFNRLVKEAKEGGNPKKFSVHTVTLQNALDQGFLYKLQLKLIEGGAKDDERIQMDEAEYFDHIKNQAADDETFMQEYMCEPSDDASAFLSYDDIEACQYHRNTKWETNLEEATGPLYIGVDIGRVKDLTCITVMEKLNGIFFVRRLIVLEKTPFDEQEAVLYPLLALRKTRRCCIDRQGMGFQFAERARKRFGNKVEEVNFTPASKEEMGYDLRLHFEERTLRIPTDEKNVLISDLRSVKKDTTAAGNVRLRADRDENGHADRFWSLALATHAGKTYKSAGNAVPVSPSRFSRAADRRDRHVIGRTSSGLWAVSGGRSVL